MCNYLQIGSFICSSYSGQLSLWRTFAQLQNLKSRLGAKSIELIHKERKTAPTLPSAHPFAKQQWYPELAPKLTLLGHTARICPLVGLHILFIQLHGLNVLRHCNACTYNTNFIAIYMRGLKSVQYLTVCWIGCLPTKT